MYLRKGNKTNTAMRELMESTTILQPYIYHQAVTGSKYVKFSDERLRSVRIADHPGKTKYKYKWNVRVDKRGCKPWAEIDEGIERFYYPVTALNELVEDLLNYDGLTPRRFKCALNLTTNCSRFVNA